MAVRHSLYDPQMAESENITLRARAAWPLCARPAPALFSLWWKRYKSTSPCSYLRGGFPQSHLARTKNGAEAPFGFTRPWERDW